MAHLNNFTQYYLLRNGRNSPVNLLDAGQMEGLDIMDRQQAAVSTWWAQTGMAVNARPEQMEALPSSAIRLANPGRNNTAKALELSQQSKQGFKKFNITDT